MASIIIDGAQRLACPKCNQGFPLAEGVSRHTVARCAEEFERTLARLVAELEAARRETAELRRRLEQRARPQREALSIP
jgi:hypothetical protein